MCHSKLSAEPESKWTRRVRPFSVDSPEEKLDDLRRRIVATRWPREELVDVRSQGVQLAMLRELARYLVYCNEADKGGHFAAWEEPQLLAAKMRAAFASLR